MFVAAVALQLVVLYAPRTPGVPGGPIRPDLLVHFAVFALVTWTGRRAGLSVGALSAFVLAQAVVSEAVQHWWLAGRSGDPVDLLADGTGVVVGLLLPTTVPRWMRREDDDHRSQGGEL